MKSYLHGSEIREWREKHKLTQDELGTALGLHRVWVNKVENGKAPVSASFFFKFEEYRRKVEDTPPGVIAEEGALASYGAAAGPPAMQVEERETAIREHIEALLSAADGDIERLGWLWEQLQEHLTMPRRWAIERETRAQKSGLSLDAQDEAARSRRITHYREQLPPLNPPKPGP